MSRCGSPAATAEDAALNGLGQILDGVWRFEGLHPDWTEDEGGEDGWEQSVAWWGVSSAEGLVLIDPLVANLPALDGLVRRHGGIAGIIRTCHWHERSIGEVAARYGAEVWAKPPPPGTPAKTFAHAIAEGDEPFDVLRVIDVERADEIALWLASDGVLIFGDAMIRRRSGELRVCPDSWTQPPGGPARLREILRHLTDLPVEHVLVSHGPLVLGDGSDGLAAALDT